MYNPLTLQCPIELRYTKELGKGLYATRFINAGELLFEDVPVVASPNLYAESCCSCCSHCSRSLLSWQEFFVKNLNRLPTSAKEAAAKHWPKIELFECSKCQREKYCSEKCREMAWKEYHCWLCPSSNPATTELYDFCSAPFDKSKWPVMLSPMLMARLLASIHVGAHRLAKELGLSAPTLEFYDIAAQPFQYFFYPEDATIADDVIDVYLMMRKIFHSNEFLFTRKEFDKIFFKMTCNSQQFGHSIDAISVYTQFIGNIGKAEDGALSTLRPYLGEPVNGGTFAGLFPLQSCLNHSCDGNVGVVAAQITPNKSGVEVRAGRTIRPGEELTHIYVPPSFPRKERRNRLFNAYHFMCECQRCQYEGDDDTICTGCSKAAPPEKPFSPCDTCFNAWYCSEDCQTQHWQNGHRVICRQLESRT